MVFYGTSSASATQGMKKKKIFTRSHGPCRDPLKNTFPDPLSFRGVWTLGVLVVSEDGERGSGKSNETESFLLSRSTILKQTNIIKNRSISTSLVKP